MALMTLVFVYGTLKMGQPNHFRMTDADNGQAKLFARARTVERFPLVIATKNNVPFLLNVPGMGQQVRGEIYNVDKRMLDFLDEFESCPEKYQRTTIQLEILDEKTPAETVEAFVYSTTTYQPDWLQKETYESYDTHGPHGLEYNCREGR